MEAFQKKYKEILESKAYVHALKVGAERANIEANKTLRKVKEAVGLLSI